MAFSEAAIGIPLEFEITDDNGAVDLSEAESVLLYVKGNARSPFTLTPSESETGLATYTVQDGDFPASVAMATVVVTIDETHSYPSTPFLFEVDPLYAWRL